MPFIKVETNVDMSEEGARLITRSLSELTARLTGKPESYVMAEVDSGKALCFGGSFDPAAFVRFESIGLPAERHQDICAAVCDLLHREATIPPERIYVSFKDIVRSDFGWNSKTF